MDVKAHLFINQHLIHQNKKDKDSDYVLNCKSKRIFKSKLKPLYTTFLNSIKLSGSILGIKFDKNRLAIEKNNYLTKIVNVYTIYYLVACQRNLTNNFKFKNCFFGATNTVKNRDNEKYVYSGYRITFDSGVSWRYDDDFPINVVIFGV